MDANNRITEVISISEICRLCANQNDKLIGIYTEDGINNELATKMNMYLPIKVNESDDLPLQCCWQCASTVLAWHELVITSLEADRRLKNYQLGTEKQADITVSTNFETVKLESNDTVSCMDEEQNRSEEEYFADLHSTEKNKPRAAVKKKLYSFNDKKIIKIRRKKSEITASFFCHICNRCYTRKYDLQKHIILKHPDEKYNMETSSKAKNAYILEKCKSDGFYKCDFCESKFQRSQILLSHRRIHTQEKPHICHICGKQFNVLAGVKRHIEQVHHKIKKFCCEICFMPFDSNDKKEEHVNIHTDDRPYMCAICGQSFRQRSSLFAHKVIHSNSYPYECRWCKKKVKRKSELKHHEQTHTGEKRFSCDECMKSFSIYQNLKKHNMTHFKYSCVDCGITFGQKKLEEVHNEVRHPIDKNE